MKISDFSIRRPVFVSMIFCGLFVLGIYSLRYLPIDLMPDVTFPAVSIITIYPGSSSEDVEELVTKPVEDYVSTVPNLKELTSLSLENISVVTARFKWGTNIDEAANDIRSRLDMAKSLLPDEIENPVLFKFDMSLWPIMFFGVSARESYPKIKEILEEKLADPLKRIPGVALVSIFGAPEREIHINVFPDKLAASGISLEQLKLTIKSSSINMPAGKIKWGRKEYNIRIPNQFTSLKEIEDTIIGYRLTRDFKGVPVLVKDVAQVEDDFKEKDTIVNVNGKRGVIVMVQKQSGTNTVLLSNLIKEELKKIKEKLPSDIDLKIAMDSSLFIKRAISNLTEAVLLAAILVVIVVFLFLRHLRGSIIISLTIPFSIIVAFIFMFIMNYTINIISLFSLAIAIGMVVDDAIVIYENIYRYRTFTPDPFLAASKGADEVGRAVIASTLTVICVFLPIVFIKGITSVVFTQLGFLTTVVILTSLFISLTLTPMLSSRFLGENVFVPAQGLLGKIKSRFERGYDAIEKTYMKVLNFSLLHRKKVALFTGLAFLFTLYLSRFAGTEFFPEEDQGEFRGFVELPSGTRIDETVKVLSEISKIIERKAPEVETYFMRAGATETGFGALTGRKEGPNTIMFGATLVPKIKRKASNKDVAMRIENEVKKIPGVYLADFSTEDPMVALTSGTAKPLSIEIYGEYFPLMEEYAKRIKEKIEKEVKGVLSLTISREKGKPELWILPDRWKSVLLGLNLYQISDSMRTYFQGDVVSKYKDKGKTYDIVVKAHPLYRDELLDLSNAVFITSRQKWVTLDSFAERVLKEGPVSVERKNQQRIIKVEGDIFGRPFGDVVKDVKKVLKNNPPPEGVDYNIGGYAEEQKETFFNLSIAFVLAVLLVYMIMAAQYESLLDPFIIMFSVPFSIMGVILGLLLTKTPFSILTFIGLITLVGIVVKNGIVLVDYTNLQVKRGKKVSEAVIEAGRIRLRPVLMTAFTTVFGMVPLALLKREGSEMWRPFAITVISGLMLSTLITLVFIPVLYSLLKGSKNK